MKYMGSKSRIAKHIVPIIQGEIDKTGCCYLAGYKKGTQDIAKFHNSVWKAAEREALKDGKGV